MTLVAADIFPAPGGTESSGSDTTARGDGSVAEPGLHASAPGSDRLPNPSGDRVDVVLVVGFVPDHVAVDGDRQDTTVARHERDTIQSVAELFEQRVLDPFGAFEEAAGNTVFDFDG